MNGAGKLLWGYYKDGVPPVWIPIQVDSSGRLKVDMSNINLGDLANVSVASPTNGHILYYHSATGLWKAKAHTALTTGVHGAGANYLALAPAASHLVRTFTKGWTSGKLIRGAGVDTDPTEIKTNLNLFLDCVPYVIYVWRNTDRFTQSNVGSGSGSIYNLFNYDLKTGATINSVSRITSDDYCYPRFSYLWAFEINPRTVLTDSEVWLAFMSVPGTPSLTQNHWGWRILNGRIYASCGNDTNGTQTDTGIDVVQYANRKFVIQQKGWNWLKYYVDGTLVATLDTNLPIGAPDDYINFYIKNTVAANREIWVSPFLVQEGSNP